MARIMAAPAMQKHVADLGLIPFDSPSIEGITTYLASEREKWGALVKKLGLEGSQ
jgi:tripartite-type tricarboxylate transporter receptor subunit TctC